MLSSARRLNQLIRAAGARTLLFETWGYLRGDQSNWMGDTYGGMQRRLRAGYLALARALHARVAPVGDSWQHAINEDPALPLWASDGKHPSVIGSYLTASVFYAMLEALAADPSRYRASLSTSTASEVRLDVDQVLTKKWHLQLYSDPFGLRYPRSTGQPPLEPNCRPVAHDGGTWIPTIESGHVSCASATTILRNFIAGKGKVHVKPDGIITRWTVNGWRCLPTFDEPQECTNSTAMIVAVWTKPPQKPQIP
jgi:hypothetical protein